MQKNVLFQISIKRLIELKMNEIIKLALTNPIFM